MDEIKRKGMIDIVNALNRALALPPVEHVRVDFDVDPETQDALPGSRITVTITYPRGTNVE